MQIGPSPERQVQGAPGGVGVDALSQPEDRPLDRV